MKPFASIVRERAQRPDIELVERAFEQMTRWAFLSGSKLVSLDEVAWLGAVLYRSFEHAQMPLDKFEAQDENGARVVSITASDSVKMADGAG